jgi:GNAT superfamily N-acetyltransferase
MHTVTIQREPIHDLWVELWPLMVAHWDEIATWQDIPLDPDTDAYEALDEAGMLRLYTVRDEHRLVGYAAYTVRTHLHYRQSKQAVQDVIFLLAEYRCGRTGMRLIEHADAQLAAEGVQVVFQHVKTAHNFGPLLERLGYEHVENVYAKRLKP